MASVNMEACAWLLTTSQNASVLLDSLEHDAKSMWTNALAILAITEVNVLICLKDIGVIVRQDILDCNVLKRPILVMIILVLRELCVRMSLEREIILACAGLDILETIVMKLSILVLPMEILVSMRENVKVTSKEGRFCTDFDIVILFDKSLKILTLVTVYW